MGAPRQVEFGVYGGLNLAFTAGWSWRIPMVGGVGALRRVESGVYGGLELAYSDGWPRGGVTPG